MAKYLIKCTMEGRLTIEAESYDDAMEIAQDTEFTDYNWTNANYDCVEVNDAN